MQHGGADESRPRVKEVASLRRLLFVLTGALMVVAMLVVMTAPAFAHPTHKGHFTGDASGVYTVGCSEVGR